MDWHRKLIHPFRRPPDPATANVSRTSVEAYGRPHQVIGEGSSGTVMVFRRDQHTLYAVKRFRKRRRNRRSFMNRVNGEYCIASAVSQHANIVSTFDLVIDSQGNYFAIMEYCSGGDLFQTIQAGLMVDDRERDCCFKQLIRGLAFLHSIGVAHRDIKPENLLWTHAGCLKIADFGSAQVFRSPFHQRALSKRGNSQAMASAPGLPHVVGSRPYIPPENDTRWPDKGDVWSAGIVLYCLYRGGLPWKEASIAGDAGFRNYAKKNRCFGLFEDLPPGPRRMIHKMLDLNPQTRISAESILADPWWCQRIVVCCDSTGPHDQIHRHSTLT
ncbi:kinase-like domain-containing protein [Dichotomocladium elegans]|nr:kinase-like domain-containing protein [Dichotomocladium elegans]